MNNFGNFADFEYFMQISMNFLKKSFGLHVSINEFLYKMASSICNFNTIIGMNHSSHLQNKVPLLQHFGKGILKWKQVWKDLKYKCYKYLEIKTIKCLYLKLFNQKTKKCKYVLFKTLADWDKQKIKLVLLDGWDYCFEPVHSGS